jgi:two-component system sensor kinase FixL
MNWIDIAWPMVGSASLTLGFIHFLVWLNDKSLRGHLMFSIAAASVASLAIFELLLMRASSVAEYTSFLLWANVPVGLVMVTLTLFVHWRFKTGSLLLLWTILAMRLICIVINFTTGVAIDFSQITALHPVAIPGAGMVMMPIGKVNPWLAVGTASILVFIAYLVSVIVAVARRGDPAERTAALRICGSTIVFLVIASGGTRLVTGGHIQGPLIMSLAFAGVMFVISNELGGAITRATRLSDELEHSKSDLRESEQQMQLAARGAGLGLWTWDMDSDEIWFTEAGSRLFGLEPGQHMSAESMLSRIQPEDRRAVDKARAMALAGGDEFAADYRLQLPDGRLRWIVTKGLLQHGPGGDGLLMRGLILDVTERRQAEERFRLVVESAPVAVLIVDDAGHVTLANAEAERVFGYTRAELLGLSLQELVPDISSVRLRDKTDSDHSKVEPKPARPLVGKCKDASEVSVEIRFTTISMGDQAFELFSISDVSVRLRAEQEAAVQRDELAHLSRVALLGELSGSLAHELSQPLTAVLSNAQAALRFLDHDPPNLAEVRESLVEVVENDKRANEIIRRLRAMLRKERTDYQLVGINDIVAEVFKLINSDILTRGVTTDFELAPLLPKISADRVQLQQVLLNLVINACDAMKDSQSARTLTVRTRPGPNEGIRVELVDAGSGIAETDLERIFDPFVTSKSQGIGLGLAICQTIIRSHGGSLWATNNPTRGATLHFELPAVTPGPAYRFRS